MLGKSRNQRFTIKPAFLNIGEGQKDRRDVLTHQRICEPEKIIVVQQLQAVEHPGIGDISFRLAGDPVKDRE